jgi:hypothetical protein
VTLLLDTWTTEFRESGKWSSHGTRSTDLRPALQRRDEVN